MSSNTNNRASPSGGNGSASNSDRPRLTDAEKKQNHIISEQKRRQAIRQGFDRLATMTPGMTGMGRSEATVLAAAVGEIKTQTDIKERIKRKLMKENPEITSDVFENFYLEALARQTAPVGPAAAPANNNVSSPTGSNSSGGEGSSKGKSKRVKKET